MSDESGTDNAEYCRKVASRRKAASVIMFVVNVRGLQLECARMLHESLLVHVLLCDSETMIRREKESLGLGLRRWTDTEDCWVLGE